MNKTLCIAAAAAVAACAGPQASIESRGAPAPRSSAYYYCLKDRLNPQAGGLECNWQPTGNEACTFRKSSTLERASLASDPEPAGRCNTGEWLVKVSPR